jgi:hypothetical protein
MFSYIIISILAISIAISVIKTITRLYSYYFGKYNSYVVVPNLLGIVLLVSFFIPIGYIAVMFYVIFLCKPIDVLIKERAIAISSLTSAIIVESTENMIINNKITDENWINNSWKKHTRKWWIDILSHDESLLKNSCEKHVKISIDKSNISAVWTDLIKHYMYLIERE